MLETLFISGLIVLPLGVAVILILYRARFFVVGIIGIVTIMMLIWAGLRFAAMFDEVPEGRRCKADRRPSRPDGDSPHDSRRKLARHDGERAHRRLRFSSARRRCSGCRSLFAAATRAVNGVTDARLRDAHIELGCLGRIAAGRSPQQHRPGNDRAGRVFRGGGPGRRLIASLRTGDPCAYDISGVCRYPSGQRLPVQLLVFILSA